MRYGLGRMAAVAIMAGGLLVNAAAAQQLGGSRAGNYPDQPTVSVNFKGGTLEEFVQALRAASDQSVNIALTGDVAGVRVDPVQLRDASPESALRAVLSSYLGPPVLTSYQGSPVGLAEQAIVSIDTYPPGTPEGAPVIAVSRRMITRQAGSAPSPNRQMVEVYSIQPLVQGDKDQAGARAALTAIEAALALAQDKADPEPEIKFHQDSGLLLARGTGPQLALVSQVVKRMVSDHGQRTGMQAQQRMMAIERQADVRRAEIKLQLAESRLENAKEELAHMQELVAKGEVSSIELPKFMSRLQQAKAERDLGKIDMERLMQEAEVLPPVAAPADNESQAIIQTLQDRIEQLERELADLKKARTGGNPRQE